MFAVVPLRVAASGNYFAFDSDRAVKIRDLGDRHAIATEIAKSIAVEGQG